MKNIVIDCDPGYDDMVAILLGLANKDKLNILGITTVFGNDYMEVVSKNALNLIKFMKENIEIYSGAVEPLMERCKAHKGIKFNSKFEGECNNSVNFIHDLLKDLDGKITIVAIGPLTNIAILIKKFPDLIYKIEEISLMGGGISGGNITSASEFNIYKDPEAAKIVFKSNIKITMSGLHVTNKAYIKKIEYEQIKNNGIVSNKFCEIMDEFSEKLKNHGEKNLCIHDACAIMYLTNPEIFKYEKYHIDIITDEGLCRGMTLADRRNKKIYKTNTNLIMDIDRKKFVKLILEGIKMLDLRSGVKNGQN